ncbi:MAG: chromosomal replication initiation protein chromosomal replication initiator protein [Candidatus Parcubacteria bacterium]|jgi:chromosomal replication initiator protein
MSEINLIWKNILERIKKDITPSAYNAWLKDAHVDSYQEGVVYINVNNPFAKDWIQNKYVTKILNFFREVDSDVKHVEYVIAPVQPKVDKNKSHPAIKEDKNQKNELPLKDHYIDLNDNLNPKYVFETVVVGSFNELAYASAQAVIKKPAVYNPLFFHGSTGVGKTHLMQSVGNYYKNTLGKKVYYVTSERFTNDYISSLQNNKAAQFKEKYRKYDLLIMDDIQFLSNKEKTQEELFHLFNYLYDNQKQIIFSSDLHPNYLPNLESRLKSRFSQGMIIDITKIDTESKMAIIQSKSAAAGITLGGECVQYLADTLEGSIREIEGIINNISMQSDLRGRPLTIDEVKDLTKNVTKTTKSITFKDVLKAVASYYKIDEQMLIEKNRKQEISTPRQILMYLLREDFGNSLSSIGQKLGGRDHTTVLHACEKVGNEIKNNTTLIEEVGQIRSMFRV